MKNGAQMRLDILWARVDGEASDFAALLDGDERARQARLRRLQDRAAFATAHGLARLALSGIVATAPRDWRFSGGGATKPGIEPPRAAIDFSLTHTDGLAAAVAAHDAVVGVDAEPLDRDVDPDALAADVLAPIERARLAALAPDARRRMFLRLWTLKEAHAKAIGLGLAHPIATSAFDVEDRAVVDAARIDDREGWRFRQWIVADRWIIAVAARAATTTLSFRLVEMQAP